MSIFNFLYGIFEKGGIAGGCYVHPHEILQPQDNSSAINHAVDFQQGVCHHRLLISIQTVDQYDSPLLQAIAKCFGGNKVIEHYRAHKCLILPCLNPRWERYRKYLRGVK